jgi:hypothetical protein
MKLFQQIAWPVGLALLFGSLIWENMLYFAIGWLTSTALITFVGIWVNTRK